MIIDRRVRQPVHNLGQDLLVNDSGGQRVSVLVYIPLQDLLVCTGLAFPSVE